MTGISDELVQRMVEVIRQASGPHATWSSTLYIECCSIVAELPKPIDPDLIEARKVAYERDPALLVILEGDLDDCGIVQNALAGIKHGRKLQAEGR